MAIGKVIGKIEVSAIGNVVIIGVDGVVRDATYGGLMYEGEQVVSNDPETLFQIKYLALPESTVYEGVFGVLADGSVIADASELETLFGDDIDFMETAAGGGEADANSGIPEDAGIFADSSVQDFYRGENAGVTGLDDIEGSEPDLTDAAINDAPVAVGDSVEVAEDESVTVDVLANDVDLDGTINPTTVVITTQPTNGTVSVDALSGKVTYTPNADYNGPDSFEYTVQDDDGATSNAATVSLTVTDVNDAPVANIESDTVAEDGSVTVDVVANDTDLDGTINPTTVVITTQPTNGTVSVDALSGKVTYTPNADYNGPDSFEYTVQDDDGATSNAATVSLTVNSVDDVTTLSIIAGTVVEDTTKAGDIIATFSSDDEDETETVNLDNTDGYYEISGSNIILTVAGEVFLDGGGTLPEISLTTSGTSTDVTATATPITVPVADPLAVGPDTGTIGGPLFDLADFTLGDDPDFENGVSDTYSSNGLVISSYAPLNFNPGHGLGVDTVDTIDHTTDEAINIDGRYDEYLDIELPSSVFALYIDLKGTGGDLIGIKLYDENGEILTGVSFEDGNGNPLILTDEGYIDGGDLSNGGDTLRIISSVKFDEIRIEDADISSNQDGFTLVNIYDPASIDGFYTYEYNMDLDLAETDGTEIVSGITLSGFDGNIITKLIFTYSDDTTVEAATDSTGTIKITDANLLADIENGDVIVTIASENEIADGFQPLFDATTSEIDSFGNSILPDAHTILGGTGVDILVGGEGNDYIDGRAGIDDIDAGIGDDTIIYDSLDNTIDGGANEDTLVVSGTLDLSNISNIEIIQLEGDATITGSDTVLGINAADVMSASGDGNRLIIESVDDVVTNEINIDESSLVQGANETIGGVEYYSYSDGIATLLIDIYEPIDVV